MYSPKIFRHLVIPIVCSLICSCSATRYITQKENIVYRDSVIIHTDTIYTPVPYAVVREVVPALDTLEMETQVAKSISYLDTTTCTLKGKLENKKVNLFKEVIYKDRIIQRDTTIYKDIPVEVDKIVTKTPKWAYISLVLNIIVIIIIGIKIYLKLK